MVAEMRRETDVAWFDIPISNMTRRASGMSSRTVSVLNRGIKAGVVIMITAIMNSNAWRYTDMRTPIPIGGKVNENFSLNVSDALTHVPAISGFGSMKQVELGIAENDRADMGASGSVFIC